jgi:hypothetical protein
MSKQQEPQKRVKFHSAGELVRAAGDRYTPDFEEVTEPKRRLVAASFAPQKRGKSRFAFTMPKPMAYQQLDANYEHVLAWARGEYGEESIKHLQYMPDPRKDLQEASKVQWERLMRDFAYCLDHYRSIAVDTMTEVHVLRRLSEHGKIVQIPALFYGPMHADYRWMVKSALASDCNVLFLHRVTDEYIDGERTGKRILDGWKGIAYDAQVVIEHEREDDGTAFRTIIRDCAQNALLMGMVLDSADDENSFPVLATRVFPDSELSDWL